MKNFKKIKVYNFSKNLFFLIFLISFFILNSLELNLAQGQSNNIPMCSSPNNLLVIPGNWQSNKFLISGINPGSLTYIPWYFDSTPNMGNIVTASNTWFITNRGLILSGPSGNFSSAGALYFRDLNKSTGTSKSMRYNEFSIFMTTSTNDLSFHYNDALRNISRIVLTISTSGKLIVPNEIFSSNITTNRNISVLENISIGTTTLRDKIYLYSPDSDQYINIESGNNRSNLKIGTLFNPPEVNIRFKEILKIFYGSNANPILTINNNQRIGVNTSTPQTTLDVRGDFRASGDVIAGNRFCLGNNCINNWPSSGGNISGAGTTNYLPLWTSNNYLGNSVLRQITYSRNNINLTGIENRLGGIISKEFCIRTDNGDLSCLTNWPNRPAVAFFYRYVTGHEYWPSFLSNLISSTEINVSNQDPYIRPGSPNYNPNIGHGYPYLELHDIINRIGVDPNDPYSTKWFILGYSYRQVYTNRLTALFIEEGDNLNPWKRYTKRIQDGLDPNNPDDVLVYCHYRSPNGAIYVTKDKNECFNIRDGQLTNYDIVSFTYAEKNSNIRGYVVLDLRYEPANQRIVCTKRNYLNSMSIASWGKPSVINLRINSPIYPNLDNDPCVDYRNRRPNLHSLVMGRFRVKPYPTTSTTHPDYISSSPIIDFLNNNNTNFKVVIKSLGIVELLSY